MTVRELVELNQMITDIVIDVRENGSLHLDQLNIGPERGMKPPYPTRVPKKPEWANSCNQHTERYQDAAYVPKSINSWDDGKDYWQIKVNRIPDKWLDLEVYSWEVWPASYMGANPRRYRNVNFHGQRLNITALPSGENLKIPEEKPKQVPDEQLDGQMSINDWNYEVMDI